MKTLRTPVTIEEMTESVRELLDWAESVAGYEVSPGVVASGEIFAEARNRLLRAPVAENELLAWRKQLREEIGGLGFADGPDADVNGGDAVEYLGKLYDDLEQMIETPGVRP